MRSDIRVQGTIKKSSRPIVATNKRLELETCAADKISLFLNTQRRKF
jgi:hypothetical protein